MFEPNISISSDGHNSGFSHEMKQLNNFKAMLKGVPPPSSITLSQITVEDMLDCYKNNEKSFGLGLNYEKKDFGCSEENSIPFLNFLNLSCNTETIASLMQKVQERYIQLETLSSCNIWFKSILQSIGSSNKQNRVRQNTGISPGRRLSHLARRRQYFSCTNLQQIANLEKTRQIEIRSKYEGKYKKINQSITFEKLNSSKRALFLSPEGETPKKYANFRNKERKPFSPKFEENKRLPFQENSKKLEVSKWLSEQNFNIDFPRKRLRDECLNHTFDTKRRCPRRSLNFENEEVSFSSSNKSSDNNSFSDKKAPVIINKLSQNHKNKLLWAVSIVLKENKILRSDDCFKICASTLFHKCRKNLNEIFSLQTASGTSEKMLQYARSQISSVLQELNINFPTTNKALEENKTEVQNNKNSVKKLVDKFSSIEESKENLLENKVKESHMCLLDSEVQLLFQTPRKVSRKRTVKSCHKEAAKVNNNTNLLKRCRSLESLNRTKTKMSCSNILKDLKEFMFSYKKEEKKDRKKLSNISNAIIHNFEPNTFTCSKDDSNNASKSIPSVTEHTKNNEASNSFSLDLTDKDFSLTFSPIPTSVKNCDSPVSLFSALRPNSYNSDELFDCNNYTPNTECSREISDQDEEMKCKLALFASHENVDGESQCLKFKNSDNNSNEENKSEIIDLKSDSKLYKYLETEICDTSASSYKEEKAYNKETTMDNSNFDISTTDNSVNKSLNDSAEIFDKFIVHQSSCLIDDEDVPSLNSSDLVVNKTVDEDSENKCDLTVSSNITDFENIPKPSFPERNSIEKGVYKPRKLVVKKSKANWKVVRPNSEEAENTSHLKLKMRLSHEWEVIHRTSYSSDATNNSENEGNYFTSSQILSVDDEGHGNDIQVESDRDYTTPSFHEDIKTTNASNCSEHKLFQSLEDDFTFYVQSNKLSEFKTPGISNENVSLSVEDVDNSISTFASRSCKSECSILKEDSTCEENQEVNERLQEPNLFAMNFSQKNIKLKEKALVESEKQNGITNKTDILNEEHNSEFFSCGNKLLNQNELEFQTDQAETEIRLNVFKSNTCNRDVNRDSRNEKNKTTSEIKDPLLLFEKETDGNMKAEFLNRTIDEEVVYERGSVFKGHNFGNHYFEKYDNYKNHLLNNSQEESKSETCLGTSTISNSSDVCSSSAEEFKIINQYQEKNSPSRCDNIDTFREKDIFSSGKLDNCVSNLIPDSTEESQNSSTLIKSKPTKQFLTRESCKSPNFEVIKNLEEKISQPKDAEDAEEIFFEEDKCNMKKSKTKIYNIKLKHQINKYKCKIKYKDKRRKKNKNEHNLKDEANVLDNLNYSDLTQEKQINSIISISDDSPAHHFVSTNEKDKVFSKSEELLKVPMSEGCVTNEGEINSALQPMNLNGNKLSNFDDGEKKTENINVRTIVSALSALSTLVEEQIKLENEKMKTKTSNKGEKSTSEPENLRTNWLDVISCWCDKNLNNLKSKPDLFSDSLRDADNNVNVEKHFGKTKTSQDCEIKTNNLKNTTPEDGTKNQIIVKCDKQQNDILPGQRSDSESKNEGGISETANSNVKNFEKIKPTACKKMSNLSRERIDANCNDFICANNASHSLNKTEKSSYNCKPTAIKSNCRDSDAFSNTKFQVENASQKHQSQNRYRSLEYNYANVQQHRLKPAGVDCNSECKFIPRTNFWGINDKKKLLSRNVKHSGEQSVRSDAYRGSVSTTNAGFFQDQGDYGRRSTVNSSNVPNSHFHNSSIQRPQPVETNHFEVANGGPMPVYNSQYLMKSLWPQSNFQFRSNSSKYQQLPNENFTGRYPPSNGLEASYYGSQSDCASGVHAQFRSPNMCFQRQPSMFYQYNNVCNVYSSWQFPPEPNGSIYKQNLLNDQFQSSNAFSYQIPNMGHINYFRDKT